MKRENLVLASAFAWVLVSAAVCAEDTPVPSIKAAVAPGAVALRDPYVPPAKRVLPTQAPTTGADLQAQVEAKLRHHFDEADKQQMGTITEAQAKQSGWGFVANHFSQIDTAHSGAVTFEQIKDYMRARGGNL